MNCLGSVYFSRGFRPRSAWRAAATWVAPFGDHERSEYRASFGGFGPPARSFPSDALGPWSRPALSSQPRDARLHRTHDTPAAATNATPNTNVGSGTGTGVKLT